MNFEEEFSLKGELSSFKIPPVLCQSQLSGTFFILFVQLCRWTDTIITGKTHMQHLTTQGTAAG
jgi:hypothetical protein